MKAENRFKIFLAAIMFTTLFAVPMFVQNVEAQGVNSQFKEIFFLGKGISANQANNTDLYVVSMGAAQVTVNVSGQSTDVTVGVLNFGEVKYLLKDITSGNGTSSGNIYNNSTVVGNYQLTLVSKPSDNIWAGTLTLNGVTYNTYLLEAHRQYTPAEEKNTVADYCQAHHDDANCRNKIEDFCQNNPSDQRCVALVNNFCKSHLHDGRCREALKNTCEHNSQSEQCTDFCKQFPKVCGTQTTTTTTSSTVSTTQTTTSISSTSTSSSTSSISTSTSTAG